MIQHDQFYGDVAKDNVKTCPQITFYDRQTEVQLFDMITLKPVTNRLFMLQVDHVSGISG